MVTVASYTANSSIIMLNLSPDTPSEPHPFIVIPWGLTYLYADAYVSDVPDIGRMQSAVHEFIVQYCIESSLNPN